MRKLALDFQRREAPSAAGWLLLAAGVAASGALGWQQWLQWDQQQAQSTRRAHVQALIGAGNVASAEARDDPTLAAARQLMERSRQPWNPLFSALAAAEGEDVALLAVAPDAARRQVKIHAEARNLNAMLAFQRQLQQQPALAQVVLLDHTVMKDAPFQPVRFHLLAQWGVTRAVP